MGFDGATKTQTRPHGATKDHTLVPLGALNRSAMDSPTALAGTNGVDVALVTGDTWFERKGNETENIKGWLHLTVSGDEVHKILGNLSHRVNGTTNDVRVKVHNQTNIAPRNDEFLHTRTEIHHQKENRVQKTEDIDWTEKLQEFKKEHYEFNWLKYTNFFGLDIYTNPVLAVEAKLMQVARKAVASENTVLECEIKEFGIALGLIADQVKATVMKAAAAHLKAIGFNGNAGVAVNGDSPLA